MQDHYIEQYGRRIFGLCMALCRHRAEAENLYQETWLRALDRFGTYDPTRDFEPWITRICVNLYRNMLRRRALEAARILPLPTEKEDAIPAPGEEEYTDLRAAVDALPCSLRTTVILYYFRDMDVASVSQVLSVPPGTVKSRLSRARKLLKEVLLDEDDL